MNSSTVLAVTGTKPNTIIADELVTDDGVYGQTELKRIRISPDNRKRFDPLTLNELAASIKAMGVAQPILIRPVTPTTDQPEDYEIVAGERRYRASIIAGLLTIPAMRRKLSDVDAAKIRILENLQRENPHEMEEADGYQLLMMQHGFSAEQIATEVHKSKAYIYARLKLCALAKDVREQFLENKIPASTALLIARIPVPALQVRALDEILNPPVWQGPGPMSYRASVAHLQARYMLDLKTADFDLADSKLHRDAGACSKCPKRTGNQPEVFADISADVCTDPDCFTAKKSFHIQQVIVLAQKQGIPTFENDEDLEAYDPDDLLLRADASLQSMDRLVSYVDYGKPVSAKLSGSQVPPVKAYLHTDGKLIPIFEASAVQLALEDAGVCNPVAALVEKAEDPNETAPNATRLAKMKAEEDARRKHESVAAAETAFRLNLYRQFRTRAAGGLSLQSLREFVKLVLVDDNSYALPNDVLDVYGLENYSDKSVSAYIDQAGLPEVQLILIDLVLGNCLAVAPHQVGEDGTIDDDYYCCGVERLAALHAMATWEGISPTMVRIDMEMATVELKDLANGNISDFIRVNPHRINELKEFFIQERPYLLTFLEAAAVVNGFHHSAGGFTRIEPEQPGERTLGAEPMPAPSVSAADGDLVAADDEDLEAAMAEPEPARAKTAPKAKPSAKKLSLPATPAAAPEPATKPGKGVLAPDAAWPFPKSSRAALTPTESAK